MTNVKGGRHHAQALLEEVAQVIAPLGLSLAPDKTRVVHIDDGFDFLGHTIVRRVKRGTSKTYVFTFPSTKAMRSVRDRTRELTKSRSTLYIDLDELLLRLNRSLRGANYFRHGSSSRHFQQIDYHAWKRIGAWIRRKPGVRSDAVSPGPDHGSPTTGSPFTAPPASRSSGIATAARRYRPPGPSTRLPTPIDQ